MKTTFCSAVLANGGQIESISLNAKAPGGPDLSIDIGWFGPAEPKHVFIHSSCDEAGSLIQQAWLEQSAPKIIPPEAAVAIVHGLNTAEDAQAARRYQLYLSSRLLSADRIVVIDVRTGRGRSGDDRLIIEQDNLYSRMLPLAQVEYAVHEFGAPGLLFRNRWRDQILESGKEVLEDAMSRALSV